MFLEVVSLSLRHRMFDRVTSLIASRIFRKYRVLSGVSGSVDVNDK